MSSLNKLYETYKDRVEFFLIYIREAHPQDSARPDKQIKVKDPKNEDERAKIAETCQSKLDIDLPILIDNAENETEAAYSAWPDRLFLVGDDGKILYRGGQGPMDFKPDELRAALEKLFPKK